MVKYHTRMKTEQGKLNCYPIKRAQISKTGLLHSPPTSLSPPTFWSQLRPWLAVVRKSRKAVGPVAEWPLVPCNIKMPYKPTSLGKFSVSHVLKVSYYLFYFLYTSWFCCVIFWDESVRICTYVIFWFKLMEISIIILCAFCLLDRMISSPHMWFWT